MEIILAFRILNWNSNLIISAKFNEGQNSRAQSISIAFFQDMAPVELFMFDTSNEFL